MPFTPEQFFYVFEKYNQSVFPMQIVLTLAAFAAILSAAKAKLFYDKIAAGLLAFLWLWTGIVYHLLFFTEINFAAYFFGALFITQGFLFFYHGVLKKRLRFNFEPNINGILGVIFIFYALIFYPIIGYALGHKFPASPTFGAPCPTTIFTFGLLMWAREKFAGYLLIIPVSWSLIGISAALNFGVKEDFGLLITAIIGTVFILRRD